MVAPYLAFSPQSEKGFESQLGNFCVEFASFPYAYIGFLWGLMLPTKTKTCFEGYLVTLKCP